jgi:hypothetical protein
MDHLFHLTNCHGEWTVIMQAYTYAIENFSMIQHYWRTYYGS